MARIAALVPVIAAVAGAAAAQTTRLVPAQYATVQAAIAAAVPGDTVLVAPGTYVERIDFLGKAITVRSAAGAAATILDGNLGGTVVSFVNGEPATAVLEGFTVTNGLGVAALAGGIQCTSASPTIRACTITGNRGRAGATGGDGGAGGIHATGSALRLFDCDVGNNIGGVGGASPAGAGGKGGAGGMYLTTGGAPAVAPIVQRCRFVLNRGGVGGTGPSVGPTFGRGGCGGVEMFSLANSMSFVACQIVHNEGGAGGTGPGGNGGIDLYGAVALFQSGITLASCSVVGNLGGNGGTSATSVGGNGGGTLTNGAVVFTALGSTIAGNTSGLPVAVGQVFGGIAVGGWQISSATLRNTIVWGNTRAGAPSDLYVNGIVAQAGACDFGAVSGTVVGGGNLGVDPLFVNLAADDVHLTAASPCRHAGNAAAGLPLFDFEGDPRLVGPMPDIGADEYEVLPGSREDFTLAVAVNGSFSPAVNPSSAPTGSTLAILMASPGGTLANAYALLGVELWVPPTSPLGPVGLPELHFSPAAIPFATLPGGIGASGAGVPVMIPGGVAGLAVRLQAFALTPAAKNGVFAATAARDVVF